MTNKSLQSPLLHPLEFGRKSERIEFFFREKVADPPYPPSHTPKCDVFEKLLG